MSAAPKTEPISHLKTEDSNLPSLFAEDFFKRRSFPADVWTLVLNNLDPYSDEFDYLARYVPIANHLASAFADELEQDLALCS